MDKLKLKKVLSISIHALHAECDLNPRLDQRLAGNFNPRTPCGVRRALANKDPLLMPISIHALHAECDFSFNAVV